MTDTKEKILTTALHLFARDGYEAVSVSAIAGELGMTKGALYKHYKNKRDIFDSIISRMYQSDSESSQEHGVPAEKFDSEPESYRSVSPDNVREFTISQYRFWTEEPFAVDFRRMLTLEQYRSSEMSELYSSCLAEGPAAYMEDIFREMISRGLLKEADPRQLAYEYYAPFFLLVNVSDRSGVSQSNLSILTNQIGEFFRRYSPEPTKE